MPYSWVASSPAGTLIIDPTTTVTGTSSTFDTRLEDGTNYGGATTLAIGNVSGAKRRTIIKFIIPAAVNNTTVLNARMELRYTSNTGTPAIERWVQAHQLLKNWNEDQANKDKRVTSPDTVWADPYGRIGGTNPDANGQFESNLFFDDTETGNTWKTWDLTALTQKWATTFPPTPNYGVILWATNEGISGQAMQFSSSESSTNKPRMFITYSTAPKTVYFLKDHLGSIRATVQDSTGIPVRGYDDYDPWGYIMGGRTMTNGILPTATRNRFTGKEFDDEFNLNWSYFGARYYDAQIGRWMVVDPIRYSLKPKELVNLRDLYFSTYAYTLDNPVVLIDSDGRIVIAAQVSARIVPIGGTGSYARGVAVDLKGNVALFRTFTGGIGGGAGIGGGVTAQLSVD